MWSKHHTYQVSACQLPARAILTAENDSGPSGAPGPSWWEDPPRRGWLQACRNRRSGFCRRLLKIHVAMAAWHQATGDPAAGSFHLGEGRVSFALELAPRGHCLGVKLWLCSCAWGLSQQWTAGNGKTKKGALRSRLSPETAILVGGELA